MSSLIGKKIVVTKAYEANFEKRNNQSSLISEGDVLIITSKFEGLSEYRWTCLTNGFMGTITKHQISLCKPYQVDSIDMKD